MRNEKTSLNILWTFL